MLAFEFDNDVGPARPAINEGGADRWLRPGSTLSFLKAVSAELVKTVQKSTKTKFEKMLFGSMSTAIFN